jgi:hypothetical protein
MPGAPMRPHEAPLPPGPEFYVREASGLLHGPYPQPPAVPAGYEVVELAPHAQRAEDVRDGGPYFIACSDGQTRGPFGGADVVRLVAQGLAEKGAKCALGRRVATGASSSSSTKNPWKTTKLKHLRVHRWRATRFVAKTAKKGAVQTFQAAATAAPPQLYKTWADEEAEWAKEVVKQQSIVKTKKPSKRRAPPPPPRHFCMGVFEISHSARAVRWDFGVAQLAARASPPWPRRRRRGWPGSMIPSIGRSRRSRSVRSSPRRTSPTFASAQSRS